MIEIAIAPGQVRLRPHDGEETTVVRRSLNKTDWIVSSASTRALTIDHTGEGFVEDQILRSWALKVK